MYGSMASTPQVPARATAEADSSLALRVLTDLRVDSAAAIEALRGQAPPELTLPGPGDERR
jgi:hypothetical protein